MNRVPATQRRYARRGWVIVSALFCILLMLLVVACAQPTQATPEAGDAAAQPVASESTLDRVLSTGVLKVGVVAAIPPFGDYDENNEFVGYDRDVAQLLADDLGATLELVVLPDLPARISALLAGEVDVTIAAMSLTPERSQSVAFTHPYAPDVQVLLGRVADTDIQDYHDLAGKRVGIVTGSTQEIMVDLAPEAEIVRFSDVSATHQAFASGQVDVYIIDDGTAEDLVEANPEYEKKGVVFRGYLAMGVRRGDPEWLRWLNDAIVFHGGTGDLQAIYQKWFGTAMPHILPDF